MLSERDRRALNALEEQLAKDDPGLAEQLRWRAPGVPRQWGWAYSTLIFSTAVLSLVLLFAGAPGAAVAVALIPVAAAVVRRVRDPGGERGDSSG